MEALVLSAGGLFAAYQAGVYKALWPYWKPDMVVGTSAGALNAWLIAGCIAPDDLIDQWLHPATAATVKFRKARPLLDRVRGIFCKVERKLPLGVVSIQIPEFRPRLFRDEEITPEHLLATCSIPLYYPSVRIDGRGLVDGGLFESTPVWAAAAMGATRVIAINAFHKVSPWPIRAALSGLRRIRRMPVPDSLDVSMILPSVRLGSMRDSMTWDGANLRRWVDLGICDGEQFVEKSMTGLKPLKV